MKLALLPLELQLPGMNGLTATALLKQDARTISNSDHRADCDGKKDHEAKSKIAGRL